VCHARFQIAHPGFDNLNIRFEGSLTLAHLLLNGREAFAPLLDLGGHFSLAFFERIERVGGVGGTRVTGTKGAKTFKDTG
jgi:hypothetical protein